jgi:hypothetical protein
MLDSLKPMVVVLPLALSVFALAKRPCLQFMDEADFVRRRNVWIALTFAAFVAPNLWLFAAFALPLVFWAARVDRHPTALYVLLLSTVPPAHLPIPMPVINQLFDLSPVRILALALLVPSAMRIVGARTASAPGIAKVDLLLIAYGVLQLVLYIPFESITNTMRRAFLFVLDTYVLYFVFSRGAASRQALRDTLACFWLACVVLVPITVFETAKGWLLYTGIPLNWDVPNVFTWLFRGGSLRAQGPGGHSLVMGYLYAMGFGLWLYLGNAVHSKRLLWGVGVVMWLGLISAFSRAPWIVAVLTLFTFLVLSPEGRRGAVGTGLGVAAVVFALSLTTWGSGILDSLPFIGHADQENVEYRQQLATVSWDLIRQNPWFGNPFALSYMEDLRQGQGIIDLVNTYAAISLFYGLVGGGLFVGCLIYPMLRSVLAIRSLPAEDRDAASLGASIVACMLGTMLMLATASFIMALEQMTWVLVGMCSAYTAAVQRDRVSRTDWVTSRGPVISVHAKQAR